MAIPGIGGVQGVTDTARAGYNVAKGIVSGVTGLVGDIFGSAPPDRKASLRLRREFRAAKAGDPVALAKLEARAKTQGSKFDNINKKAVKYYNLVSGGNAQWREPESSPGPVSETAGRPFAPPYIPETSPRDSAVTVVVGAPRKSRPCKYGPRGQDGYCPKRPSASPSTTSTPRGIAGPRGKPPCKYGPRGADGYCPKKPRSSRASTTARRRAEREVTRAITTGAKKAAPVVVKYAPQIISWAARAGLVVAVGAAAYWITSRIMQEAKRTTADYLYDLSNQYRRARQAYAAQYGRNMSPSELAQLSAWYKGLTARINAVAPSGKKLTAADHIIIRKILNP